MCSSARSDLIGRRRNEQRFPIQITHMAHELGEDRHVEDELRLAELRARGDLLAQALGTPF